jgi:hypothetical protein
LPSGSGLADGAATVERLEHGHAIWSAHYGSPSSVNDLARNSVAVTTIDG